MEEKKLTPQLRFPEFENEGEWKTDSLGNLVEIKGRIGYRGYTRADIVEEGKGAITLSPSNFEDSGSLNFEKCTYITWEKYEESPEIMLEEGQTVLVKTASVGKSAYVKELPEKATINPQIVVLKPQKIEPKFLAYSIFHNYVQVQIKGAVGAGAIPNMSQDSISKFDILLPPDKKGIEQQKIASCLSSLDELIAAHKDKLDALKDHKKGLLQNLFPQKDETVPKVRFPEFEGDGEWEIRSVDQNIDLISGIALKSKELTDDKSGTPILRGINITEGQIRHSDEMDKFYLGDISEIGKYLVKENDIVIGMDGSKVGKNVSLISKQDEGAILIQRVARIRAINSDVRYLYQHFFSNVFRRYVDNVNTSSGIPHISAKQIRDFEIGFPPTIEEQQKIASCLSALDELIMAQAEKIEQLKMHKKGLMQGLFPSAV